MNKVDKIENAEFSSPKVFRFGRQNQSPGSRNHLFAFFLAFTFQKKKLQFVLIFSLSGNGNDMKDISVRRKSVIADEFREQQRKMSRRFKSFS